MQIVHTAEFDSPIGRIRTASTDRGLAYVELPHASGRGFAGWLRRFAATGRPEAGYAPNREAARQLLEYLEGKRTAFELPLDLRGTPFQRRVYGAVARIPFGATQTYGELAGRIGRPQAVRAVGGANAANPIPLVIPCHRVVAAGGRLGGYGGGLALKRWLLAMERTRQPPGVLI